MYSLWFIICGFLFIQCSFCLSELEERCIKDYPKNFENEFLIGTWYHVVTFSLFINPLPTSQCSYYQVSKTNQTERDRYKDAYTLDNPYSLDDNPYHVVRSTEDHFGVIMGNKQTKFYVFDPKSFYFKKDLYKVHIFERTKFDEFIIYHECNMRGHTKYLWSRKRQPTNEEVKAIIDSDPDLKNKVAKRFCF